jgi:hypothetical protein
MVDVRVREYVPSGCGGCRGSGSAGGGIRCCGGSGTVQTMSSLGLGLVSTDIFGLSQARAAPLL